ncbi:MAG TPA: response regulator [Flavobacteriales bacterium]|nr:response regulator [Flavobacteriales bacterium]
MKHCLLIDDDQDDQEIFRICLNKINKDVYLTVVNDGIEGLRLLTLEDDYTPDYIFLDMNMPKMDGIECLRSLKKIARLRETKIFMYSTTAETSAVEESWKLGAEAFIVKPSKTSELKEKLATIFQIVSEINK